MSIFTACSTILHVFRITKAWLFFILFYFIYIAQQHVLKTFSSVKIMTHILARLTRMARTVTRMARTVTRMARTVTRMTRMARWLAH